MVVMLAIAVKCMMVQQEKVEMLQIPLAAKGETPWDGAGQPLLEGKVLELEAVL